jgi:hypothetical protein
MTVQCRPSWMYHRVGIRRLMEPGPPSAVAAGCTGKCIVNPFARPVAQPELSCACAEHNSRVARTLASHAYEDIINLPGQSPCILEGRITTMPPTR